MEATSALATDYMTRCLARPRLNRAAAVSCPHTPRRANGQGQRTLYGTCATGSTRSARPGPVLTVFGTHTLVACRGPRAAVHRCAQDEPQKPGSNLRWLLLSSRRGSLAHLGLQGILIQAASGGEQQLSYHFTGSALRLLKRLVQDRDTITMELRVSAKPVESGATTHSEYTVSLSA
jgi:hypothetical protein